MKFMGVEVTNTGESKSRIAESLDRGAGSEHLLHELAVEELAILVGNRGSLVPLGLSELVTHGGQSLVEIISVDISISTGVEDGEGSSDGGLIVRLSISEAKV
jgi:hypothetical protein